jgi:hypothetical protein
MFFQKYTPRAGRKFYFANSPAHDLRGRVDC